MRIIRHLAATTFVVAGVMGVASGTGLAGDYLPYPPYTPYETDDDAVEEPRLHFILELDPGEDVDHWVEYTLDELGVPRLKQDERLLYAYAPECTINGALLNLTYDELAEVEADPTLNELGSAALEMSIPDPIEDSGPLGGAGMNGAQVNPTGRQRIGAPEPTGFLSTPAVTVAVLDTGVDASHDDLNVVGGFNASFDDRGPDGWGIDFHGHGTHVAGIIGAIDNDRFVVGNAPGVSILSIPVLGADGSGSMGTVLAGIDQACLQRADVVNMSLGATMDAAAPCGSWDPFTNGVCQAVSTGMVIVASAGNDAEDAVLKSPAAIPGVVTVSAIVDFDGLPGGVGVGLPGCGLGHPDDYLASFSNFGSRVEITAPGGCILSLAPNNQMAYMSGTSMSGPEVTGVIAAYISDNPGCRGQDAVDAVLAWSSDPEWAEGDGAWTGDRGPDHEPLVRWGAPTCLG